MGWPPVCIVTHTLLLIVSTTCTTGAKQDTVGKVVGDVMQDTVGKVVWDVMRDTVGKVVGDVAGQVVHDMICRSLQGTPLACHHGKICEWMAAMG